MLVSGGLAIGTRTSSESIDARDVVDVDGPRRLCERWRLEWVNGFTGSSPLPCGTTVRRATIRNARGRAGVRNTSAHAADPVREHGRSGTAKSGAMTSAGSCVSSSLILTLWSAQNKCLFTVSSRNRVTAAISRRPSLRRIAGEKHRAVRLGQTAHGAPNDGGLFPPKIQTVTALVAANEVGGDLHQPRPNAGGVPKLLPRLIRLDETVASRFRANSRARSDAGKKM